jgi:hypothetical protein
MFELQIVMPVLWTIVSTLVALALYKTSKVIVQAKGARVAGSAAIAVLAFYGLFRATPTKLLEPPAAQERYEVLQRDLDNAAARMPEAKKDCLSADHDHCLAALATIEANLQNAQDFIRRLMKKS